MGIRDWSTDVILVNLPCRLPEHDGLQRVIAMVRERGDCSVVVDFSRVGVAGCTMLTRLLELRQMLLGCGQRLVLCSVAPATKGVFTIARLDGVFDFVKDKFAALAHLRVRDGRIRAHL